MDVFKAGALAFLSLVVIVLLRQWKPEWSSLLRIAAAVLLLGVVLTTMAKLLEEIRDVGGQALPDGTLSLLFKAMGIAFLTQIGASVCRDCGENGLATWVEMAGKIEILLLSFPLIRDVLSEATALLNMSG